MPNANQPIHSAGATGIPDLGRVAAKAFDRRNKTCEWKKWKAWESCLSWPIIRMGRGIRNVESLWLNKYRLPEDYPPQEADSIIYV
jgi:hypothetical protein